MTESAATELRSADPRSEVWFDRDAGIDVGAAVLWPAAYRLVVDDDVSHVVELLVGGRTLDLTPRDAAALARWLDELVCVITEDRRTFGMPVPQRYPFDDGSEAT